MQKAIVIFSMFFTAGLISMANVAGYGWWDWDMILLEGMRNWFVFFLAYYTTVSIIIFLIVPWIIIRIFHYFWELYLYKKALKHLFLSIVLVLVIWVLIWRIMPAFTGRAYFIDLLMTICFPVFMWFFYRDLLNQTNKKRIPVIITIVILAAGPISYLLINLWQELAMKIFVRSITNQTSSENQAGEYSKAQILQQNAIQNARDILKARDDENNKKALAEVLSRVNEIKNGTSYRWEDVECSDNAQIDWEKYTAKIQCIFYGWKDITGLVSTPAKSFISQLSKDYTILNEQDSLKQAEVLIDYSSGDGFKSIFSKQTIITIELSLTPIWHE